MFSHNLIPGPVSQIGVENAIWMEPITPLNEIPGVASLIVPPLHDLIGRELLIHHIEIFKGLRFDYFQIHFGQVFGAVRGELPDGFVGVEPAPARADLQAVQEVVHLGVGDVEWVRGVVQVIEEELAVSEPENPEMAALGDHIVQIG